MKELKMTQAIHQSEDFDGDFDLQFEWYFERGGPALAEKYFAAVKATMRLLAQQPDVGHKRKFRHPELQDIYSRRVEPPFDAHLIFYRKSPNSVSAERIMHGARDLPRRLREPPGTA